MKSIQERNAVAIKREIMNQEQPPGWGDDPLSGFMARCLNKTMADIGVCALEIFGLVFPEEFRDRGINTALTQIENLIGQQMKLQNP